MPVTPVLCCMHGIATPVVPSSQCRVPAPWNSSLVVLDRKGNSHRVFAEFTRLPQTVGTAVAVKFVVCSLTVHSYLSSVGAKTDTGDRSRCRVSSIKDFFIFSVSHIHGVRILTKRFHPTSDQSTYFKQRRILCILDSLSRSCLIIVTSLYTHFAIGTNGSRIRLRDPLHGVALHTQLLCLLLAPIEARCADPS